MPSIKSYTLIILSLVTRESNCPVSMCRLNEFVSKSNIFKCGGRCGIPIEKNNIYLTTLPKILESSSNLTFSFYFLF